LQHKKNRNKRHRSSEHHQAKDDPVWEVWNPVAGEPAHKEYSGDASGFDEFIAAVGSEDTPETDPICQNEA
jgi:hypothetical protein